LFKQLNSELFAVTKNKFLFKGKWQAITNLYALIGGKDEKARNDTYCRDIDADTARECSRCGRRIYAAAAG
jgi:hypothetical protein